MGYPKGFENQAAVPNILDCYVRNEAVPMDSLGSLNAFVQAAEARSFTVAGRQLGVSSSAIGKAVARMEKRLGVRLLHRSTRSIALTAEGALFLERCRRIFSEIEAAELERSGCRDWRVRSCRCRRKSDFGPIGPISNTQGPLQGTRAAFFLLYALRMDEHEPTLRHSVILPAPGKIRWTAERKRAVLFALDLGEISPEEICRRYDMHPDELSAWRGGKVYALRANRRRRFDRISEGPSPTSFSSSPGTPPTRSRGGRRARR